MGPGEQDTETKERGGGGQVAVGVDRRERIEGGTGEKQMEIKRREGARPIGLNVGRDEDERSGGGTWKNAMRTDKR